MVFSNYKGFKLFAGEAPALEDLEKLIKKTPDFRVSENHVISIDLSDMKLQELPRSIDNFNMIQELNVNNNYLWKIPIYPHFHLKKDVEEYLNFPLVFEYFPRKYKPSSNVSKVFWDYFEKVPKKLGSFADYLWSGDYVNEQMQKNQYSQLVDKKKYYWDYIRDIIRIDPEDSDYESAKWTFNLYFFNSKDKLSKRSKVSSDEFSSLFFFRQPKEQKYIRLQIVVRCDSYIKYLYLFPIIRNITLTIETEQVDSILAKFTNFYFKLYEKSNKIEFQSTTLCKINIPKFETFFKLHIIDVRVEYKDGLTSWEQKGYGHKVFNDFKRRFEPPKFVPIILKIGGTLRRWVDYIAIAFTIGVLPSIFQFFYKFIAAFFLGDFNFFSMDLDKVTIPAFIEILTYLPVFILFIYLTYKFITKLSTRKKF